MQLIDEAGRRRIGEAAGLAPIRSIDQGPVFAHHEVEDSQLGKDAGQVVHLPAGYKDQFPTAGLEPPQQADRVLIDLAMVRERAVVIGCKGQIAHQPILRFEPPAMLEARSDSTPVARMMRMGRSWRR